MLNFTNKRPVKRIACIGEAMLELSFNGAGAAQLGVAGDTYNTAVYLARALSGRDISVSYITALGGDPYSDRIRGAILQNGIDDCDIQIRNDKGPGLYAIDTDAHGERSFTYWRSDSAAKTLFSDQDRASLDILDSYDLIFASGISMAILPQDTRLALIEKLATFSNQGGIFAYDSNHRPILWADNNAQAVTEKCWQACDIALPSIDDEKAIFNEETQTQIERRFGTYAPQIAVLKRDAAGPYDLCHGTAYEFARIDQVVDSTAAGDSFNAGLIAGLLLDAPLPEAIAQAHALASRVIQHHGAILPKDAQG